TLVAARGPSTRLARAGAILMVLGAIGVAGSTAALLGLPLPGLMVTFVVIRRRADLVTAIAVVLLALLVGGAGLLFVKRQAANVHSSQNSLVRYSVARSSRSAAKRESLFASEFHLYLTGSLLGRGPTTTILPLGPSAPATVQTPHDQ